MTEVKDALDWLERGDRRLAYRHTAGDGPTILFLPGYASDMDGSKALALESWCAARGRAFRRFDYGACGLSPGVFEDQALADWRDDALAMIDAIDGDIVLVGSSMGGWLMLLAALARPDRVAALVGIAAAPDFTDWGFDADQRSILLRDGRVLEDNPYGPEPTITSRIFWESGQRLLMLDRAGEIACPVRLLHGQADPDVPFALSLDLAGRLRSADVQTILIKDGDHRLSRAGDLAMLTATLALLLDRP